MFAVILNPLAGETAAEALQRLASREGLEIVPTPPGAPMMLAAFDGVPVFITAAGTRTGGMRVVPVDLRRPCEWGVITQTRTGVCGAGASALVDLCLPACVAHAIGAHAGGRGITWLVPEATTSSAPAVNVPDLPDYITDEEIKKP